MLAVLALAVKLRPDHKGIGVLYQFAAAIIWSPIALKPRKAIAAIACLLFTGLVPMIAAFLLLAGASRVCFASVCFERHDMIARLLGFAVMALSLVACASNPLEVTVSRCPAVAIVGDTGTLTRFEGEGRTAEDVLFTASISDVNVTCSEGDSVTSAISFYVGAQSEGRVVSDSITLPYFVAVLKDNSEVVTKRIFDVTLRFDSNGYAASQEVLSQFIPTIEQARRYNYELLIGFQLSADDVAFNMER